MKCWCYIVLPTILFDILKIVKYIFSIYTDSSANVRIEDCQIVSGDDCVAIKSGWNEYGIQFGMPSQHIIITRLKCVSPDSAMIALGSEMSGGIQDIRIEDLTAMNT